jgi:hypothetical protein
MRITRALCLVLAPCLLLACAWKGLSPDDRASVRRVYVAPIELPDPQVPRSFIGAAALLGGPVGILLANAHNDGPATYKSHLAANHIDFRAYVDANVRAELRRKGFALVTDPSQADATLTVIVRMWGLSPTSLVLASYITDLSLFMELRGRERELLFRDYFQVGVDTSVRSQLPERSVQEFLGDRNLLDGSLRTCSSLVVAKVMQNL